MDRRASAVHQFSRVYRTWMRYRSFLKIYAIYILFLIYCIVGAITFHFLERAAPPIHDQRVENGTKCIGGYDMWAALFYVVSASSTIGFGTIHACTVATRVLSIFYSIVGIPLVLLILADFGQKTCALIEKCYVPLYESCRKFKARSRQRSRKRQSQAKTSMLVKDAAESLILENSNARRPSVPYAASNVVQFIDDVKESPSSPRELSIAATPDSDSDDSGASGESDKMFTEDHPPDIPVSLGLSLALCCVFACAAFHLIVDNYAPGESIYYAFLTFVAGDFVTANFNYTITVYFLIFLGFSMISTTISIMRHNLNNLIHSVKREARVVAYRVQRKRQRSKERTQYVRNLLWQDAQQRLVPTKSNPAIKADLESAEKTTDSITTPDQTAQQIIESILQKRGAMWLVSLVSQTEIEDLATEAKSIIGQRHFGTQCSAAQTTQSTSTDGSPPSDNNRYCRRYDAETQTASQVYQDSCTSFHNLSESRDVQTELITADAAVSATCAFGEKEAQSGTGMLSQRTIGMQFPKAPYIPKNRTGAHDKCKQSHHHQQKH